MLHTQLNFLWSSTTAYAIEFFMQYSSPILITNSSSKVLCRKVKEAQNRYFFIVKCRNGNGHISRQYVELGALLQGSSSPYTYLPAHERRALNLRLQKKTFFRFKRTVVELAFRLYFFTLFGEYPHEL